MSSIKSTIAITLVELLVAISILCTITAISLMGFQHYLPKFRLQAAAMQIKADLHRASSYAARNNCQYRVAFDSNKMFVKSGDYEIQKGNASHLADYLPEAQNQSFHVGRINQKGVGIASWTNNPVFKPNGTIGSLATITLKNVKGQELKISTSMAGRIVIK